MVTRRLADELGDYDCLIGRAVFPTGVGNADLLLERARNNVTRPETSEWQAA